jgi:tRNA A-37 threonylcarbamoyl transferase component Bud32
LGLDCVAQVQTEKTWRIPEFDNTLRKERFNSEIGTKPRCIKMRILVAPIIYIDVYFSTGIPKKLSDPTLKHYFLGNLNNEN